MKAPLLNLLTYAVAFASCVALHAAPPAPGKPQQLTSPDQVPDGLAKSDWQSIRAAYEAGRHAFKPTASGWQALNPGQHWTTQFDRRGFIAKPKDGGWTWGLELQSYGFGEQQQAVRGTPAVKADGQRLSYQWDATVQEWFVNDQRGLEHGFTLSERPQLPVSSSPSLPVSPLSFTMSTRGSLSARVNPDAQGVSFQNESGATVLNYAGLKVWDADGKILSSRFEPAGARGFRLLVDESTARYPITIDPIAQQAYLKANNTGAGDVFGSSVAVAGDTVIVGAIGEDSNTTGVNSTPNELASTAGAAYVFVRSGSTWSQQAYLKASQVTAGDRFGYSVAVSGNTAVISSRDEDSSTTGINSTPNELGNDSGAAYVFVRSGTTWSQQAYLKASQVTAFDNFGTWVAVAGDTVVVGAPYEDGNTRVVNGTANELGNNSGAAYVFVRSGTTWSQQAYLKPAAVGTTAVNDTFGVSVAVAGDTVVVGANNEGSSTTGVNSTPNESAASAGAAYIFLRSGTTWTQQAYLKPAAVGTSQASDYFGYSVAVDGDTVVVGANFDDSNTTGVNSTPNESATDAGAAYVFVRNGTTWTQQAYLKPAAVGTSQVGDNFGYSVAISGDTLVVGAHLEDSNTTGVNSTPNDALGANAQTGAAYVFARSGTTWTQQAYLKASQVTSNDYFGYSAAISGDTVIAGSLFEDSSTTGVNSTANETAADAGAAYVFTGFAPAPEIAVEQPAGINIVDGSTKDFGSLLLGNSSSLTFTVKNTGNADLTDLTITKDGANAADFTVTASPTAPVTGPSGSTTFAVRFAPGAAGARTAAIHIANNDSDENPFDITLIGTGSTTLAGTYTTGSEVLLTTSGFTATGNTLNVSLNFAPPAGTDLTVVNNTGAGAVVGNFTGLPEGTVGTLAFGGTPYFFILTYTGGTGNDIVLRGNRTPVATADALTAPTNVVRPIAASYLTANDSAGAAFESSQTLTVTAVSSPSSQNGTVALSAGVVTYTPANNFTGTDTFTYTLSDGAGGTAIGTVTMTVNGTSAVVLDGNFEATTPTTIDNPVTFTSTTTFGGTQPVTLNGPITLSGTPQIDTSTSVTINGVISGTAELEKTGSGTLILTNANQHSGGTKVSSGTVELGHNQALGTGLVKLNGGHLRVNATDRTLANSVHLSASTNITGTAKLTFAGALRLTGAPTMNVTNHVTIEGVVQDDTVPASLEKKGKGVMQLR
ncbi:MAG: choice-of-anchor D domain-containing protein, partial [Verrucomicrobia bacterium]|nr:choice-of-anchor D domain-containing protein [Verrucomicrobiota bacterium]